MQKTKKSVYATVLAVAAVLALSALSIIFGGVRLTQDQTAALRILLIVCGCSAAYCFIAGELSQNFSQMDKLWSLLPIAYVWIIAARGGLRLRLVLIAVIVTTWGVRLTVNFARKGAYRLKFWEGAEDYRWAIVRQSPLLSRRWAWALFDLFFISIYQNALVLAICLPALACMGSSLPLGWADALAAAYALGFLALETVADEQQWRFYETKKKLLSEHEALEALPAPYDLGFNTVGLWGRMRHPNYLGEQGLWLSLYLFAVGAQVCSCGLLHWSLTGPLFLVLLFIGSSSLGETISAAKYPQYAVYVRQVRKYLPLKQFRREQPPTPERGTDCHTGVRTGSQ